MDYGMIGKREKAKRYAEEQSRFLLNKFDVTFHGDNNNHHVTFDNGMFTCDCEFFMTPSTPALTPWPLIDQNSKGCFHIIPAQFLKLGGLSLGGWHSLRPCEISLVLMTACSCV